MAVCVSDKTSLGTECYTSKAHRNADERTEPNERSQLWVIAACYQHEMPKKKTVQVTGVVLAVCISDKTSPGTGASYMSSLNNKHRQRKHRSPSTALICQWYTSPESRVRGFQFSFERVDQQVDSLIVVCLLVMMGRRVATFARSRETISLRTKEKNLIVKKE